MAGIWRVAGGLVVALAAGTLAGNAAVSGMVGFDDRFGLPAAGTEAAAMADVTDEVVAPVPLPVATAVVGPGDCPDCGDYSAGWRWAEAHDLRQDGACRDESWGFRRGCIAYVNGGALPTS